MAEDQISDRGLDTGNGGRVPNDRDRLHLRSVLLKGANSALSAPADAAYFNSLRERAGRCAERETPCKT
jgi:antitoxin ParD1/3/4